MFVKRVLNILIVFPVALLLVSKTAGMEMPAAPGSTDLRVDPTINAIAWQN